MDIEYFGMESAYDVVLKLMGGWKTRSLKVYWEKKEKFADQFRKDPNFVVDCHQRVFRKKDTKVCRSCADDLKHCNYVSACLQGCEDNCYTEITPTGIDLYN